MKKNIFFLEIFAIIFLVFCDSPLAQNSPIEKGSSIISGNFTFSSAGGELYERLDGERLITVEFDPAVNFFVGSGFAIGGRLLLERVSWGDYTRTIWGLGPEVNYFFGKDQEKSEAKGTTYPFLQAGIFFTNNSNSNDRSNTGIKIRFGAGIAHMISNTVGLAIQAAYDIENEKGDSYGYPPQESSVSGNQYGLYVGLLIFLY